MLYTIYTYVQPNGQRKVGATSNFQRRVVEQQGGGDVLATTKDKNEASHLEAYWKGRFQLELDETYIRSEEPSLSVLRVDLDPGGNWLTSREFRSSNAFKSSDVTEVQFNILGTIFKVPKDQANKMVMDSTSKDNIYFSRRTVEQYGKDNTGISADKRMGHRKGTL